MIYENFAFCKRFGEQVAINKSLIYQMVYALVSPQTLFYIIAKKSKSVKAFSY